MILGKYKISSSRSPEEYSRIASYFEEGKVYCADEDGHAYLTMFGRPIEVGDESFKFGATIIANAFLNSKKVDNSED